MKKLTLFLAALPALAFCGMILGGLLYSVATAPAAHATSQRVATVAADPVPAADVTALRNDMFAFLACVTPKPGFTEAKRADEFSAWEIAYSSAMGAANENVNNNTTFKAERTAYNKAKTTLQAKFAGC